jgi:diguanylate cyclase (GGDEF)-like protein/PAS domain S-box-containing protein
MSISQSNINQNIYGIDTTFVNSLSIGVFYTDLNGRCLYVNNNWLEIAGLSLEEALDDGWNKAIHVDDRDRVISEWNDSVRNDREFSSEYRFQRLDESITWVIGKANTYRGNDGQVVGYVGTITNITERKDIELSLHQLAKGFSVASSSQFFRSFSMHLGEILDTDYVVVGEIIDDSPDIVKSVVVNNRGNILDPLEYGLKGTPCATVIGKQVNGYKNNIQKTFPDFDLLKFLNVEAYVGTPLFNSENKPIGIIAILNIKPIKNLKLVENILQIYAMRASAELERKQKEEELQSLNEVLEFKEFTLENVSESIFCTDEGVNIIDVNEAACRSLGYTRDELLKLTIFDIDPSITESELLENRKKRIALKKQKGKNIFETYHKRKDGRIFPVEITASYIEFSGKAYHCSIVRDISERKERERERETNLSLQKAIFEATPDGILVTDKNEFITDYNQNFMKIWQFVDTDIKDKDDNAVILLVANQLKNPESFISRIKDIYEKSQEDTFDILELKDGRIIERVSRPQYLGNEAVGRVWNFRDITEKYKLSEQLSYQANHDSLTGLVNRREFEKRLVRVISTMGDNSEHVMCYMDLDNFKQINDVCGHLAGDFLLKKISELFQQNIRTRDTLARLGGDEFGLLMEHCSVEQAGKIAENFISIINDSDFTWEEKTFDIGVSIGIVKIDNPDVAMLEIIKNADIACYAAKKSGRNCVHVSAN